MDEHQEQQNESPLETPAFITQTRSNNKKSYLQIGALVGLALLLAGTAIFALNRRSQSQENTTSPALVEPTPFPEATPEPELMRENLTLQVLNGSGVAGRAGEVKEYLEGLGYQGIEVGNADSFDYTATEVRIKDSKRAYLQMLTSDLEEEYTLSGSVKTLSEDSEYDVILVYGEKKASPSPSPSPSPEASPGASPSPSPSPSP